MSPNPKTFTPKLSHEYEQASHPATFAHRQVHGKKKVPYVPSNLPRLVEEIAQTAEYLHYSSDKATGVLLTYADSLRQSSLHWVRPDMVATIMDITEDMPTNFELQPPSEHGLLIWEDGLGSWTDGRPVDGVHWFPDLVTGTDTLIEPIFVYGKVSRKNKTAVELIEYPATSLRWSAVIAKEFGEDIPTSKPHWWGLLCATVASFVVMEQGEGRLSETTRERGFAPSPKGNGSGRNSGRDVGVTVIDMARKQPPSKGNDEHDTADDSKWKLSKRHVVRSHIRSQAYGPNHSLRRPQLIPAYVKGPDGAPFVNRSRVHVWR